MIIIVIGMILLKRSKHGLADLTILTTKGHGIQNEIRVYKQRNSIVLSLG